MFAVMRRICFRRRCRGSQAVAALQDAVYDRTRTVPSNGHLALTLGRISRGALQLSPPKTAHEQPLVLLSDVGGQTLPFAMPSKKPAAGRGYGSSVFCGDGATLFRCAC